MGFNRAEVLGDSVGDSSLSGARKSIVGNPPYFVFCGVMHRSVLLGRISSWDWRLP